MAAASRGRRTQGLWRSGHIRNLVHTTVYKGTLQYGRRSSKPNGREVISAPVAPLVSEETWDAAIATLERNRIMPNNSRHTYLLRSVIRCGVCGLTFCGDMGQNKPRYRCNGSMSSVAPSRASASAPPSRVISLKPPSGPMSPASSPSPRTSSTSSSQTPTTPRPVPSPKPNASHSSPLATQPKIARKRAIELYTHGKVSEVEFDAIAAEVERQLETLDERLADLQGENDALGDSVPTEEVLSEIRKRLDGGLSQAERQEIVQLLVRQITVHTTVPEQGRKQVRIVIDYRFPSAAKTGTVIAASSSYNLSRVIAA